MLHSTVGCYPGNILRAKVPEDRVKAYIFHPFRIGIACALLAAKWPSGMIQVLARWRGEKTEAV